MPERKPAACVICDKTLKEVPVLHRVNAKGQPAVWACEEHLSQTDAPPVEDDFLSLTKALSGR